ncbi:leucine--tRNA ligase [Candidatus Kaiserbacteria bacterium]|nr:leucine--tRNA ligase [Candidatus Kaiserbacteria bacterium]
MRKYDHRKIEKKWQQKWAKAKLYKTADTVKGKKNYYLLTEFPYPSGNLHVGHWYAFSVPDILTRHLRMQGKNVLYPIGFDAFGLPAENAAIKNKLNPRKWTYGNIAYMKKQMASMGASFDWSREVITCDPEYYKWTQWQFLQFFKNGLAYRKETAVNWCPSCKTVLANEQVVDGRCERCKTEVIQKQMLQWNLRITKYADRLVDDLKELDWPEQIKESQRNWIGRSEGAEIDFGLDLGKKYKFVLLHGYKSNPNRPRWQWVKKKLEELGHEVVIPALPNTDTPKESEQVATALSATTYDENTIVVGHSLGGLVAMKVAEKLKRKIARLVVIAPAVDPNFPTAIRRPFWKDFNWKLDVQKIKQNTDSRLVLSDLQEKARAPYLQELAKTIDAQLVETNAIQEHFTADREPDFLMWIRPTIRVFTTRADTLYGATYLVLAPEHQWVTLALSHKTVLQNNAEVQAYVDQAAKKTELERMAEQKEKTGVRLGGVEAINPATGEKIPIYVADYVLAHYGTGAIMAVPAHDERDFEFAKKFNLPIRDVISSGKIETGTYTGEGRLVNSANFSGIDSKEARSKMTTEFGTQKKTYKLRDWIVSRQRYWGVPIPIIHCKTCGQVAVPDKDLPVKLPEVKDYLPDGSGRSPLAKVRKWVNVKCPKCKGHAERETDTLDTFVDSSWYFLRYIDPKNKKLFSEPKKQKAWMPINLYSGGAEHTTMHVLYSRFWQKALFDLKLAMDPEPYTRRMNRSLILGPDGQKMSKSRGNVIDPDSVVAQLGADTVRMYLAFVGPYNEVSTYPWNPDGVVGVRRFLERVWRLREKIGKGGEEIEISLHKTIKKVSEDIPALKFNTAIAQMMSFLNEAERAGISKAQFEIVLRLLSPFAPHIADELWAELGHKKSIHLEKWPAFKAGKLVADTVSVAVQINGKTRTQISISPEESEESAKTKAIEAGAKWLEGRQVLKVIYVKGRIVNLVIAQAL